MKTRAKLCLLSMLLALAGCVPSLHPLYTDADVVFDPALIGVWGEKSDAKETWAFTKDTGKAYHLVDTDKDGKTGNFVVHLVDLGGTRFLDLYPADPKMAENDFYKMHLVPAHSFALVSEIGPALGLAFLNPDWLKKTLESSPDAIKHEVVEDTILLTAQPKELQRFLLANLKTKNAFGETRDWYASAPSEMGERQTRLLLSASVVIARESVVILARFL